MLKIVYSRFMMAFLPIIINAFRFYFSMKITEKVLVKCDSASAPITDKARTVNSENFIPIPINTALPLDYTHFENFSKK